MRQPGLSGKDSRVAEGEVQRIKDQLLAIDQRVKPYGARFVTAGVTADRAELEAAGDALVAGRRAGSSTARGERRWNATLRAGVPGWTGGSRMPDPGCGPGAGPSSTQLIGHARAGVAGHRDPSRLPDTEEVLR